MKNKNGREERESEIRISRLLGGIVSSYLALCFIAPMSLPSDSVPELSGRANAIDYAFEGSWGNQDHGEDSEVGHDQSAHGGSFIWTDLSPIWAFVYAFGDLNCHQKYERSLEINGNQQPVCTRDIGIFFGFAMGCLLFGLRGFNRWTVRDTFLSVFPDNWMGSVYKRDFRLISVLVIITLGVIPMALDGFTQLLVESYESNNPLRLVTGAVAGFVGGWWVCSAFSARPRFFTGADSVVLPLGSRLVSK